MPLISLMFSVVALSGVVVCWGKIARYENYVYCICGDPEQTLKAWDSSEFKSKY